MVPVVPTFSNSEEGHIRVFGRVGQDIVGMITVQMGSGVDKPGEVKNKHISQRSGDEETIPEFLPPVMLSDLSGEYKAHVQCEPWIQLLLEHDYGIFVQVSEIQFFPCPDNLGMLLDIQPAHVSEEKSPCGIVRIGIGLGILVMNTMVTSPVENGALVGDGVAKHEGEANGEGGAVRAMGPQAVHSYGDPEPATRENRAKSAGE